MAIKAGLRTLLLAQSSITTLCPAQTVGGTSRDAIFVNKALQGIKPPYIIISRIGHDPYKRLDGTTGMTATEIDIDCYEYTEPEAEAMAVVVKDFLKDYSGAAGASDTIDAVLLDDVNDFINPEESGGDVWRHAVTLSFTIQHH